MKKIAVFISLIILCTATHSQTASSKGNDGGGAAAKWSINPFDDHVFIENKGQFDGKIKSGEKILYSARLGRMNVYFTAHAVIYRYDSDYHKAPTNPHADPDEIENVKHVVYFLEAKWKDANKSVYVEAEDELPNYYTYPSGSDKTIRANIFREIIYKNLYPGIDAVYQFINGKAGLKYSLIIHPGADLSLIKINYSGAKSILRDSGGDLIISTGLGVFNERAPVTSYADKAENIPFSNMINGNIESFKALADYDKTKTIVIDPWVTNPHFTGSTDAAYDLSWDYYGNVYVYGSYLPFQLIKMNNLGVVQWTYNAVNVPGFYGAFTTDKVTGTSYLVEGTAFGRVCKVNTLGALVGTYPGGGPNDMNELWRVRFDQCNRDVIIAGGGNSGALFQAAILDTGMSIINNVNVLGTNAPTHDMSLLTIDPDGKFCYMAVAKSAADDPTNFDNDVMQLPLPSLSPTTYIAHEQCHFIEDGSVFYVPTTTNGMNGAAASPDALYLYNSDTVRRYVKNTGVFVSAFPIRLDSAFQFGGLDVDACDNLFVGVEDSIYVADSSYTILYKIPLPGTVFDVQLGQHGALYACGKGFVTQLTNPVYQKPSLAGTADYCTGCNGTATLTVNCGIAPLHFLWSNGNTSQTITGLCAGQYSVTISDGSCPPGVDTAVVTIPAVNSSPGISACCDSIIAAGQQVQLISSGGGSYSWSPQEGLSCTDCPDPVASPNQTTTYTLTIKNDSGCVSQRFITIDVSCGTIFVPDAFTPGKAYNNIFYVRGRCIASMEFKIFDRWGNEVFKSNSLNDGWDGNFKDTPMNMDTYVWFLKATLTDGTSIEKKGSVTLVR